MFDFLVQYGILFLAVRALRFSITSEETIVQLIESWLQPFNSVLAYAAMMAVWRLVMIFVNKRNAAIDARFAKILTSYGMTVCHHFTDPNDKTEWLTLFYFADGYEHAEAIRKGQEFPLALSPLSGFFFSELVRSVERLGRKEEFVLTCVPGCWRLQALDPICA